MPSAVSCFAELSPKKIIPPVVNNIITPKSTQLMAISFLWDLFLGSSANSVLSSDGKSSVRFELD